MGCHDGKINFAKRLLSCKNFKPLADNEVNDVEYRSILGELRQEKKAIFNLFREIQKLTPAGMPEELGLETLPKRFQVKFSMQRQMKKVLFDEELALVQQIESYLKEAIKKK